VGAATWKSFVRQPGNLWLVYNQAKTFRVLPCEVLRMQGDPLAEYSLNNAVWLFGSALEAELSKNPKPDKETRKEQQRRTRILDRWIPKASDATGGKAEEVNRPASAFRTPTPTK
jgi:hypothetical protein